MKRTGCCPKCGSTDLLVVEPGLYNSFPTGLFSNARIQRYVCRSCGYTEEWVAEESMEKIRHSWDDSPKK